MIWLSIAVCVAGGLTNYYFYRRGREDERKAIARALVRSELHEFQRLGESMIAAGWLE